MGPSLAYTCHSNNNNNNNNNNNINNNNNNTTHQIPSAPIMHDIQRSHVAHFPEKEFCDVNELKRH